MFQKGIRGNGGRDYICRNNLFCIIVENNWAQSGNFALLLRYAFVGYLSQLNLRTPCLNRHVNKFSAKHFYLMPSMPLC
jgi:hypothetical protein